MWVWIDVLVDDDAYLAGFLIGLTIWAIVFGLCGILAARYRKRDQVWGFIIGALLRVIGVLLILVFPEGKPKAVRATIEDNLYQRFGVTRIEP
jgi:hypothetical protein